MPSQIENKLALVAWLAEQFGFKNNKDMLSSLLKEESESWTDECHPTLKTILSRPDLCYNRDRLEHYDSNIRHYLDAINAERGGEDRIQLKYFQYLSMLMTEVLLDNIAHNKERLIKQLNEFVSFNRELNNERIRFDESDLNKLAIWGATGCGKTLLMHLHYYQFLHYAPDLFKPMNILLITPNEALSAQHIQEMTKSGIPCARVEDASSLRMHAHPVRVIEITKIVKNRSGKGVSIPLDRFEAPNLLFVDEGHKGSGGRAWFDTRHELAKGGFAFEYSATFGQALHAAAKDELDRHYFKHIAFDYSYAYFYGDGYGKDFDVLNLPRYKPASNLFDHEDDPVLADRRVQDRQRDLVFLANLMALCEQLLVYETKSEVVRAYNLERPLLLFLGSTVNTRLSDVAILMQFLQQVVSNRDVQDQPWVEDAIKEVLSGQALLNERGRDAFSDMFFYLKRRCNNNPTNIYKRILKLVFHADSSADLRPRQVGKNDQLGLKVGETDSYFGLVYVGGITTFGKKMAQAGVQMNIQDHRRAPLFETINDHDSSINILIGARKFMEGWNSWRVSGMGLLNVGRGEGPQIIQLFGRGVRLKGKGFSLKRTGVELDKKDPIKLLERLNIFGVNADYIRYFRDLLEAEGVNRIEISLPTRAQKQFINMGLYEPHFPPESEFRRRRVLNTCPSTALQISMRVSSRVSTAASDRTEEGPQRQEREPVSLGSDGLNCIDAEALRLRLLEDKFQLNRYNILLNDSASLRKIVEEACHFMVAEKDDLRPRNFADRVRLQDLAYTAVKKYMHRLYRREQKNWETDNMGYAIVQEDDPNLLMEYKLSISKSERTEVLIETIRRIKEDEEKLDLFYISESGPNEPTRVYYERHLYLPLFKNNEDKGIEISPPPLEPSEVKFVKMLRNYARQAIAMKDQQIVLLRNRSRGKGIGFYEDSGFFPDFILWIKEKQKQKIIFVEPHGLRFGMDKYKKKLHQRLQKISKDLAKDNPEWKHLHMDCYILSTTAHKELEELYTGQKKQDFEKDNILFLEDGEECVKKIFDASA